MVANGTILSTFQYLLPVYTDAKYDDIAKLQRALFKTARIVTGNPCFKWSTTTILNKLGWLSAYQQITVASLTNFHKMSTTGQPRSIFNKYNNNQQPTHKTRSSTRDMRPNRRPTTNLTLNSYEHKTRRLYNNLPVSYRLMSQDTFKANIKTYVKLNHPIVGWP
jgi:hypothetical protein